MRRVFFIISVLLMMISALSAQNNIRIDKTQIDSIIKELKGSLNIPGIAVGIAENDEIKYINISGYSNLETKTELNINSIWHICSLSKQFSTVACLKLAEENRLSLQDKISGYIDNLPEEYTGITVSNLLSQTSGIKDYLNDKNLYGLPWEKVKNQIFSDTLNFKPGNGWSYSNTGFWIIARIIEKVTGMDYNQYLSQTFFNKLKMEKTQRISGEKIIASRVNGYVYKGDELFNPAYDISKFYGQGDGDLMSTLNDLLIWNIALTRGKIINEKSISRLWTPSKLNNGKDLEIAPGSGISYGLGWFISDINKDKVVWTPGAGFGFSISSQYIPKYNLTVIVCCNKEQFLMATDIGSAIARYILPLN
jgi:CubicO group peptidase (beta-lactamase class C family)